MDLWERTHLTKGVRIGFAVVLAVLQWDRPFFTWNDREKFFFQHVCSSRSNIWHAGRKSMDTELPILCSVYAECKAGTVSLGGWSVWAIVGQRCASRKRNRRSSHLGTSPTH